MESILSSSDSSTIIEEKETPYVLTKKTWSKYDMGLTKNKVDEFLASYLEARTRCLNSVSLCSIGLTTNISLTKTFNESRSLNGGFATFSEIRIDDENFIKSVTPAINKAKSTFTKDERDYYEFCMLSNNSEDSFRRLRLNGISKNGLKPIKFSCILKLALPLGLDVKKNNIKGGDDID